MAVELRTLRITSDFDAGRYVAGMNQKIEADRAGAQSSRATGEAVDGLKIKVSSAVPLIERLSRTYIDGYGSAAKFNSEILKLARSQDTNAASAEHLELIYAGLQKKFGLTADASELASRGFSKLAEVITTVNSRLNQMDDGQQATALAARMDQLRQAFDPAYVSSQRLSGELNDLAEAERLGVQLTQGYEQALEAIVIKHDAAAAAAKRQRDEYAKLAQEGREALAADRAQADFNGQLGVGRVTGLRASDSAAAFSEQLGRQEEIARLRAQQQAEQFAQDLRQRFAANDSGGSARESASVFAAEFSRQEEIARLRAQQQGAGFASDLNDRLGVNGFGTSAKASASAFEEAARAAEELERRTVSLRAQINPLGAAQNRLNAELADYEDLARRGQIGTDELSKAQLLARQRYDAAAKEIERQNKRGVSGLPSYQATNLLYQGTDVVQSLALGMPLTQVFLQQGPQIAQIFYQAEGTMTAVLGLLNPIVLGLGAVGAAAVVGALAWNGYLKSIKEVETASAGLGRATAGPAAQMEAAAQAGAAAAGISVSSARTMEAQFLRTGRIGSEQFEQLISISKDFGATIGVSAVDAGSKLAEMFSDPAQAAQTLYQQYGLINASTVRQVSNLAAQNRQSEAQTLLLRALPSQLADAERATTSFGRQWQNVANWASNAYDAIGKAIDRSRPANSPPEQLSRAQQTRSSLSTVGGIISMFSPYNALRLKDLPLEADLNEQVRRGNAQEFERSRRASQIAQSRSVTGLSDASGANADAREIERLQNEIKSLQSGKGLEGVDEGRRTDALEAKTRVLGALINRQQRAAELDRLDIEIQSERNPLLRAELEAKRARLQLTDQEISSTKIEEEAQRARNRVINETIAAGQLQAKDMAIELDVRRRLASQVASGSITAADANRLLQEEVALRPLVIAAAAAEGQEKARLLAVLADLRQGYAGLAQQQKEEAAQAVVRSQKDRLETLRTEISLVGQSDAQRRKALALLEAEQQIRREGLGGTAYADQIRQNAAALSEMTTTLERQTDAWNRYRSAGESAIDSVIGSLTSGKFNGKDLLKSLWDDVRKPLTDLWIGNPIKNAAFGTNYGTLDDLLGGKKDGGILSSILGGQSVGAMTVNAATVMLNGGVSGGLGGVASIFGTTGAANSNVAGDAGGLYRSAIKSIESSGNYGALGPMTASGDRAYGAYQVMGANIGPWSQQALGRTISAEEFLRNPSLQDRIFDQKFGSYVNQYGPSGAAQAWFGGPGSVGRGGNWTDSLGTSGNSYVTKFNGELERLSGTASSATGSVGGLGVGLDEAGKGLTGFGGGLNQFSATLSKVLGGSTSGVNVGGLFSGLSAGGWNMDILSKSPQVLGAVMKGSWGLWDRGGYTGPGGVNEPAGVVHRGEVVWSQRDVARVGGVAAAEGMRLGLRGFAGGGTPDYVRPPVAMAANSNESPRRSAETNTQRSANIMVSLDGARGDREIQAAAYRGMQQALREYDAGLPDRVADINARPRYR